MRISVFGFRLSALGATDDMGKVLISAARTGWARAAMIVGGLALAGVAVAMAQGPAPAAGVQKVRFGGDRNETRIVIDLDRAATG